MTTLVLLAHAASSVVPLYQEALKPLGGSYVVRSFVSQYGNLSSGYQKLADHMRDAGGRILPKLLRTYADGIAFDKVAFVWWSAGYALARELLRIPDDRAAIDTWVALDGLHSGFDADGTASDQQLQPFLQLAEKAKQGKRVFWLGHSDVTTHGYASTTQTAGELRRLGGPNQVGWWLQGFDVHQSALDEHKAALLEWGPSFVAGAEAKRLELSGGLPPPPPPSHPSLAEDTLGVRALQICEREMNAGVQEIPPGSNSGPRISQYLRPSRRNGGFVFSQDPKVMLSGDWCAAAQSFCAFEAARDGERIPHEYRCSVREIWADALALGHAVRAADREQAGYVPAPGDLILYKRSGADPTKGGIGHIERIKTALHEVDDRRRPIDRVITLSGNSGVKWAAPTRLLDAPDVVGFVRYQQALRPSASDLCLAAFLRPLADQAHAWVDRIW